MKASKEAMAKLNGLFLAAVGTADDDLCIKGDGAGTDGRSLWNLGKKGRHVDNVNCKFLLKGDLSGAQSVCRLKLIRSILDEVAGGRLDLDALVDGSDCYPTLETVREHIRGLMFGNKHGENPSKVNSCRVIVHEKAKPNAIGKQLQDEVRAL